MNAFGTKLIFSRDDLDLIVSFAGCSLDEKPGSNWVQRSGGLPEYICEIARAIKRSGKSTSQAISIAVSRVKKWASGVGVDKDTQAKAAKALAEWEKLKVKNKAKGAEKKVSASNVDRDVLLLANASEYSMEAVRDAFSARTAQARRDWRAANPTARYDDPETPQDYWVKEVWNTFLIVQSSYGKDADLYKVPYTVDENADVTFDDPIEVKTQYVVVDEGDEPGGDITDEALKKLLGMSGQPVLDRIVSMSLNVPQPSPLERIILLANRES